VFRQATLFFVAKKFAKSPTPSQEMAHVTALKVVILASRRLCLPKKFADHYLVNQTQRIDVLRSLYFACREKKT